MNNISTPKDKNQKNGCSKCDRSKYPNWFHDTELCKVEKTFHLIVFFVGWFILISAMIALFSLVFKSADGKGIILPIIMFLLVLFGVSCISDREMTLVDEILEFMKKATLLKIPGMQMQRNGKKTDKEK